MNEAPISRETLASISKEDLLALIRKRREEKRGKKARPYIQNMTGKEFKRMIDMLPNPESVYDVLGDFAKELGRGSSRKVFDIGPHRVIKVAFNRAGVAQNHNEIELWEELQPFVPKIYDYHPDGYWIEMEKVDNEKYPTVLEDMFRYYKIYWMDSDFTRGDLVKEFEKLDKIKDEAEILHNQHKEASSQYVELNNLIQDLEIARRRGETKFNGRAISQEIENLKKRMNSLSNARFSATVELRNLRQNINMQAIGLWQSAKNDNLSIESVLDMYDFMEKIWNLGLYKDFGPNNIGFSRLRNVPVILDFGYKVNDKTEYMYSGDRDPSTSPNFSMQQYFDATEVPNPRIAMESFFISENQNNTPTTPSIGDVKKIIDMIHSPEALYDFLDKFGKELGQGSSRSAFRYAPGKVIKLAFNRAGVMQNLNEIKFYSKLFPFVPEIYDYHPDGYWIEMEEVSKTDSNVISKATIFIKRNPDAVDDILSHWDEFSEFSIETSKLSGRIKDLSRAMEEAQYRIDRLEKLGRPDWPEDLFRSYNELKIAMEEFRTERKTLVNRFEEIKSIFDEKHIGILFSLQDSGMSKEDVREFFNFAKKLNKFEIDDISSSNVGFSQRRGVPVILDYGMDPVVSNSYGRKAADDFDMFSFYDKTDFSPRDGSIDRVERFISGREESGQ